MVPIILAVSAKQDSSVNTVLDNIKKQVLVTSQGLGLNLLPPSALTGVTAAQTAMGQLAQKIKDVGKELQGTRTSLDDLLTKTPGLSDQAAGYDRILTSLKSLDPATKKVIDGNKALKSSYELLTKSAEEGLQGVADRAKFLGGVAGNVAAGFAGIGTVFAGIATGSLAIASNFEQLNARLVAVTGSVTIANQKFEAAKTFAAESPFDLAGAVRATATLESYKQSSEELLPVAAALAAGMGTDLQQATLAVGKAASGSAEAWSQLRDTYGITSDEIIRFGGVASKSGGLLDYSTQSVQKNREALIKLVNLRFGDAVAKQSATLAGAMSNVGDAAETAAAGFGQTLIPVTTQGARLLADFLGVAESIPGPFKAIAAAGLVVGAGLAGLGAAAAGTVASLLLLQASLAANVLQLRQLKIESPLASNALQTLTAGATRVSGAMTASRLASVGLVSAFGAVAAVAGVVGTSLIDSWQKTEEAMGDAITQASRDVASANQAFRRGINGINEAGKSIGVTVGIVRGASNQVREVADALAKLPSAEVVNSFGLMAVSAEDLDKELKTATLTAIKHREALEALAEAQEKLRNAPLDQATFETVQSDLGKKGLKVDTRDDVNQQLDAAREQNKVDQSNILIARRKKQAYEELVTPLQEAAQKSESLSKFLTLATQAGTANSLAIALADVNEQIDANAKLTKGAVGNIDVLIAKLNDPKVIGNERELASAQLKLVQQRATILEAQAKQADDARKAELDANDLVFRKKKATQDLSLTAEIQFQQSQLQLVKAGSEEEVKILEDIAQKKQQIHDKEVAAAKKAAEDRAKAVKDSFNRVLTGANQGVADARAGIATAGPTRVGPYPISGNQGQVAPSVLQSLELARTKVEAWAESFAKLHGSSFKGFEDLQAALNKFRSDNAVDIQKAKAEQLKTTLETLAASVQTDLANSVNNTQRLATVEQGLGNLQRSRRAGLVNEADAQKLVNQLTKQKEQLEKSITAEQAQRAQQTASLELSNAEANLSVLQARKANGEKVDKEILASTKAIFQQKLEMIEAERAAAVEAANGEATAIAAIEQQAKLKREGLITQETLARKQAADQQTQAVDKALGQQEQRYNQFFERIGGPNSPIQSIGEAFSSPGSFNLGPAFSLNDQLTKMGAQTTNGVNSFRKLQSQVRTEADGPNAQAQDIALRRAGGDAGRSKSGFNGKDTGSYTQVSINVNGAKFGTGEKDLEDLIFKILERVARSRRV